MTLYTSEGSGCGSEEARRDQCCHTHLFVFQSDEVEAIVLEKINGTLEKYMGINDEELGKCACVGGVRSEGTGCVRVCASWRGRGGGLAKHMGISEELSLRA